MNQVRRITVIGATGMLGRPVVHEFLKAGVEVTAIVRDMDRAKKLLPETVHLQQGDVTDVNGLNQALLACNCTNLYLSLSTKTIDPNLEFYPEREGIRNIVEACEGTKVRQIIKLSGLSSLHPEFALEGMVRVPNVIREEGERFLIASKIPHTIMCATSFLDTMRKLYMRGAVRYIGPLPHKLWMTNSIDFAAQVLAAVDNPDALNRSFAIQGKEGMTSLEVLETMRDILYPEAQITMMPLWLVGGISYLVPSIRSLVDVMKYYAQYRSEFVAEESFKILGEPRLSATEFFEKTKEPGFPTPKPEV